MIEYLINNKEWIFSGVGIFALGLILTFFRKKDKSEETHSQNQQNHIKADKVNFSQTFVNNSSIGKVESIAKKVSNPKLKKIKDEYFGDQNIKRHYLITKLAKARNENSIIEIRTITDRAEEEFGWKHSDTVAELEKLEEEGIIRFSLQEGELLSPYTRIRLTEKYFEIID